MSWTCPNCKAENPEGARFCTQCGAPAQIAAESPQAAPTPHAEAAPPAQSIAAPSPPNQNQAGGAEPVRAPAPTPVAPAPAPAAPVAPTTPQPPKKGGKGLVIALVIGAVLLIGFCLLGIIATIAIPNFLAAKQRAQQKRSVAEIHMLATAIQLYMTDKGSYPPVNQSETETYGLGTIEPLQSYLAPAYLKELPKADGWGNPYLYGTNKGAYSFILISLGSDGVQGDEGVEDYVTTSCFQDDILWRDSSFVQAPEGKQRDCKGQ